MNRISFRIEPFGSFDPPVLEFRPIIDDVPLDELAEAFERDQGFDVAGGYGGLVPDFYEYGPFDRYLFGDFDADSHWSRLGAIWLLGCDCGEAGCWPLEARVRADGDEVVWERFRQPHRPQRDYSGFGPFRFALADYRAAVQEVCRRFEAH